MVGPKPARAGRRSVRRLDVRPWLVLLLFAAAADAACGTGAASLSDLEGLGALQTRFNRDAGTTRIVLLLSPT